MFSMIYSVLFQSTHPHGVRLAVTSSYFRNPFEFQSTHPHGVRRELYNKTLYCFGVSIHAPTRGATHRCEECLKPLRFQSTHPHGVRRPGIGRQCDKYNSFNPRTHTGCDLSTFRISFRPILGFNPRTHTGCDSVQSYIL